jgi:hypothetical protein
VSLFGIYSNEFTFHIGTEGVIFREKGGKCKARIENDGPKKKKPLTQVLVSRIIAGYCLCIGALLIILV